jgi:hypothetical protein
MDMELLDHSLVSGFTLYIDLVVMDFLTPWLPSTRSAALSIAYTFASIAFTSMVYSTATGVIETNGEAMDRA